LIYDHLSIIGGGALFRYHSGSLFRCHSDIFQIFSKRTEVTTTLVTTNLVPSDWGKIFDSVTASAILDRLSLNGKFITFEGRSYRSKK